jgi:hypothetical protein
LLSAADSPREPRAHDLAPLMSRSPNERPAVLEQKVSHLEEELDRMAGGKVDEVHAILLQARWAKIALGAWSAFPSASPDWFIERERGEGACGQLAGRSGLFPFVFEKGVIA